MSHHNKESITSAPPLVFIHGLLGGLEGCAAARSLVSRSTFAPDLLGYGTNSHVAPDALSIAAQVEHVRACMHAAFPGRAVDVIGHSVGGVVGVLLARRRLALALRMGHTGMG